MPFAEETDDHRQEYDNERDFRYGHRSSSAWDADDRPKRRERLDPSQTQELEDLALENQQLAERLKALDDENATLKHTLGQQKEEIVALQDLNDKTGSKLQEEDKDTKTKLHVFKDKVNLLQKQMRDDKALSDMLSKEQKLRTTLERRLEDASDRLREAREEIVRLHEEVSQSEQQKQQHEKAYSDLCREMEELQVMSEADKQAAERQAQELNDQLMMMSSPGSCSLEGAFGFGFDSPSRSSAALPAGQDLLSQLQTMDDEAVGEEIESPELVDADARKELWEEERRALTSELSDQRAASDAFEKALAQQRHSTEKLEAELREMRLATEGADKQAKQAKALWEEEKAALTAELAQLAAQQQSTEKLEAELGEMRSKERADVTAKEAKAVWEEEKAALTAELAAQRATSEALEKALAQERSSNQSPGSTTNAKTEGFNLPGAASATAAVGSAERVAELEGQVLDLESELAKTRRLLQRFQDERDQSSWSSVINSFMCATNR